jgi:hypothetical protein
MLISLLIVMFVFLFLFQLYQYFYKYREGLTNSNCELQTLIDIAVKQQFLEDQIGNFDLTIIENRINELSGNVAYLMQSSNAQQNSLNSQASATPNYSGTVNNS